MCTLITIPTSRSNMKKLICKIVLLLTGVCTILSAAAIAPALPTISKHFNNSALVPWILLASNYAMMCSAPFFGKIVSRFGVFLTLRVGLIWYLVFGCLAYALDSLEIILASRVAFALGVVAVMVCLNVLVARYFEGAERRAFIGLQGFFASLVSLGIIQASGYLSSLGWNVPFILYGYGFLVFLLTFLLPALPDRSSQQPQASHGKQVKVFTASVTITLLTLVFAMMVYYVCMLYGPFLMSEIGGTPSESGTAIVLLTLTGAVTSLLFGHIKLNSALIFSLSFLMVAVGYFVMSIGSSPLVIFCGISIAGLGIGFLLPNSTARLMTISKPEAIPTVMSFLVVCIFGGNALGGTTAQFIRSLTSTSTTFAITAAACLIVSVLYLLFRNK